VATTKAEEVFNRIEAMTDEGVPKADAFKSLAAELSQPVNSVRGSYYTFSRTKNGGGTSRTRRRETTPDDALADARAALERAIGSIDREVDAAKTRADEAKAEHEALKASASERKATITERLEALK